MTIVIKPSGASIRERVLGQPTAAGDPFLAPFFETAIEHVWGGLWNRPGLELKYRSLVAGSVLAATGVDTAELEHHLCDELCGRVLQGGGYAGFSAAHVALRVLSEIAAQR